MIERESRPAGYGPANDYLDTNASIVGPATDYVAALAACSGPEDPAFKAASLLADAWKPALDRSYSMGYENGYCAGWAECERDMADHWRKTVGAVRTVLAQPSHDEVMRRRGEAG